MIDRKRPVKQFRVVKAHGCYRVGQLIQPTGMLRQVLVVQGVIEEVLDEAPSLVDRMVQTAVTRDVLTLPKRRRS